MRGRIPFAVSPLAVFAGVFSFGATVPSGAMDRNEFPPTITSIATPSAGQSFRDCTDCPDMVIIPAGSFVMGSPLSEPGRNDNEGPQHLVTISTPLAVSMYVVTFAAWDACAATHGCPNVADDGMGRGLKPVVNVSWDQAGKYVEWLSRRTGLRYRLLSESEWEYAARAGSPTLYFWGDEVGENNANCNGCGSKWDADQTSPVGSFKPNAFGLYDMNGNVWEWVGDCYRDSYAGAPADESMRVSDICNRRVVRGGSWTSIPRYARSAFRFSLAKSYAFNDLGFRVARTLSVVASSQSDQ